MMIENETSPERKLKRTIEMLERSRPIFDVLIPLKENSQRLPGKNLRKLNGRPLFLWILDSLKHLKSVTNISIFSSTSIFIDLIEHEGPSNVQWIKRSSELDKDDASMTDVINAFCEISTAEIIVLVHATSPFLSAKTIENCMRAVESGDFRTAFAAVENKKFAWFAGKPLNYDPEDALPRTQDLEPILFEQSGLYVFRREDFLQSKKRISAPSHIETVAYPEDIDIDEPRDFLWAQDFFKNKESIS